MPHRIELVTYIKAPQQVVYDLSRSVELHMIAMAPFQEKAIGGRRRGLINFGETVTWRAKHFGFWWNLTSVITALESPTILTDAQYKGPFSQFVHEHSFTHQAGVTALHEIFTFTAPLGPIGYLATVLYLKQYLRTLLELHSATIKQYAESDQWKSILQKTN